MTTTHKFPPQDVIYSLTAAVLYDFVTEAGRATRIKEAMAASGETDLHDIVTGEAEKESFSN